jgi:tRNA threonylcarbamoyladenosine biosynthesis protein TsaB
METKPLLLILETALDVCSVVLSKGEEILAFREEKGSNIHSAKLTVFIEEVFEESKFGRKDLDAVCVSMGPGSYTGLRIGVSAAKAISYALDIPLIAVNTLEALTIAAIKKVGDAQSSFFCPMIDARRMEVYCGIYNHSVENVIPVHAAIVGEDTFRQVLETNKTYFFGNGMPKCREILSQFPNASFIENIDPSAHFLLPIALQKFNVKHFENTFIFEPYYLKDFMTTAPSHKVDDVLHGKAGN